MKDFYSARIYQARKREKKNEFYRLERERERERGGMTRKVPKCTTLPSLQAVAVANTLSRWGAKAGPICLSPKEFSKADKNTLATQRGSVS